MARYTASSHGNEGTEERDRGTIAFLQVSIDDLWRHTGSSCDGMPFYLTAHDKKHAEELLAAVARSRSARSACERTTAARYPRRAQDDQWRLGVIVGADGKINRDKKKSTYAVGEILGRRVEEVLLSRSPFIHQCRKLWSDFEAAVAADPEIAGDNMPEAPLTVDSEEDEDPAEEDSQDGEPEVRNLDSFCSLVAIQWALLGGEDFILSVTADPRTAYRRYLVMPQREAFFSCSQMPQYLAETLAQGREPRLLNSTYNPQRRDNHIMLKSLREFAQSTDFLLLARCLLAEVPRHYFPSVAALHDMRRLRNHPNGRIVDLDAYATHRWLVDGRGWYAVKNALMVITYALPTSRQSAILPAPRNPELLRLGGGSGAVAYSALIRGFRRDKVVPQSFVADTNARVVNLLDKALSAHSSSALKSAFFFSIVAQRPRVSPPSRPGAVDGLLVPLAHGLMRTPCG